MRSAPPTTSGCTRLCDPVRSPLAAGALLLALTALAGCSDASGSTPAPPRATARATTQQPPAELEPPGIERYVALGDSFTAAPFVPTTSLAEGCLRSSGNFPSLLAADLGAELTDVSCSGADTDDMAGRQPVAGGQGTVAPQLRAVTPDTDLVTLGIGGNDANLYATLTRACTSPPSGDGDSCERRLLDEYGDPASVIDSVGRSVTEVLRQVRRSAPDATVALIGYPRLASPDEDCPDFPLAEGDAEFLAGVEGRLNEALRRSARAGGAEFVDLHSASQGHEICSDDPWVNGRTTDQSRALAYHPFAEGQRAVADELLAMLGE
jgi:lysophospholipase L1-like esterase